MTALRAGTTGAALVVLLAVASALSCDDESPEAAPAADALRCDSCGGGAYPDAWLHPGLCATVWASNVDAARGAFTHPADTDGDVLVVARGDRVVLTLWDGDGDGVSDENTERAVLADLDSGDVHSVVARNGFLFASTATTVFRWPYTPGSRAHLGDPTVVVTGMNADGRGGTSTGNHRTRTLLFDADDRLYVSVGSKGNVDADSFRSRIRRFSGLADAEATVPVAFVDGEVFADGLRNEVGLAIGLSDPPLMWGVENGADNLVRSDIGDVHDDNPAEELNAFPLDGDGVGAFYGYPYCWSEYSLPEGVSKGRGAQWAWPDGPHTDEWCEDPDNVVPPALSMMAHSAPLGLTFFDTSVSACRPESGGDGESTCVTCDSDGNAPSSLRAAPLPCSFAGNAFVAFHGSWNRDPPTGYKVVMVPFDSEGKVPSAPVDVLRHAGDEAQWDGGLRPVNVVIDGAGFLYVTSDNSDEVLRVFSVEGVTDDGEACCGDSSADGSGDGDDDAQGECCGSLIGNAASALGVSAAATFAVALVSRHVLCHE